MFFTRILFAKKTKSKQILVLCESIVSGHQFHWLRDRVADKIEVIRYDPFGKLQTVNSSKKRLSTRKLNGSARVLNDTIVSIHSGTQLWSSLLVKGVNVIKNIQNHNEDEDSVQKYCELLGAIVRQMKESNTKLLDYSEQLKFLAELEKDSSPPFISWKYDKFYKVAEEIANSYSKEMNVKEEVAKCIHKCTEDQLNFLLVAWTHTPYLTEDLKFDAMLVECGLK